MRAFYRMISRGSYSSVPPPPAPAPSQQKLDVTRKPARGVCLPLGFHPGYPGRPDPGLRCFPEYHPGTHVCPEVCGETRVTQSDARTGHFWPFLVLGGDGRRGHRGLLGSKPLGTGASAREPGSKELLLAAGACLSCHHAHGP